jgi:hypothetical protein
MKITKFSIDSTGRCSEYPFLRANLHGDGCSQPGCNCSPPYFISISDGETGLCVELTKEEAVRIGFGKSAEIK